MKKVLLFPILVLISLSTLAQKDTIDPYAISLLDKMSAVIGELESCTFGLFVELDRKTYPNSVVSEFYQDEVHFAGPDKFMMRTHSHKGDKGIWFVAGEMWYYSYYQHNYSKIQAPSTSIAAIDSVSRAYDIKFPAADFFYPTFTDDVILNFPYVVYVGNATVGNSDSHHILAENDDMVVQIWLANDAHHLPLRYFIHYKKDKELVNYRGDFVNWDLNPVLPDHIFEFIPPPGSRQIDIVSKNDHN